MKHRRCSACARDAAIYVVYATRTRVPMCGKCANYFTTNDPVFDLERPECRAAQAKLAKDVTKCAQQD